MIVAEPNSKVDRATNFEHATLPRGQARPREIERGRVGLPALRRGPLRATRSRAAHQRVAGVGCRVSGL